MRSVLVILLIASSARAATYTPLVDLGAVEPACRPLAVIPQHARTLGPSYDAAISTASCMVITRTRRLALAPNAQSVRALDDAVAPALAILDRVIRSADPEHVLLALYAKRDILAGNTARLLATLPKASPMMSGMAQHDRDKQVGVADQLTETWRRRAANDGKLIAIVLRDHPELATRNEVLAYEVAASRLPQATGVARR